MTIRPLPEWDRFDPTRGYSEAIEHYGNVHMWFGALPQAQVARNAYYQGFITEWEFAQVQDGYFEINLYGYIHRTNPNPSRELLTKERIEQIYIDMLLGLGDGKTSLTPNQ